MLYDNRVMDLKTNIDNYLEKDFELACNLSEKVFEHAELIQMLKNGNIQEKQLAALLLDSVTNDKEGLALVNNLTGCDGKIREAVALKINQLLNGDAKILNFFNFPEIFADASIDINANICRLVINSVGILKNNAEFSEKYLQKILIFINETFAEIDKFIFRDKKYVINKQLFRLYWCLESLKLFVKEIPDEILFPILERASKEKEYTIREKVAQILMLTNSEMYSPLIATLKNDENYYVRLSAGKIL